MTMIGWLFVATTIILAAILFMQRLQYRWVLRELHRNISASATIIDRSNTSAIINTQAMVAASRLLRRSARTIRQYISEKDVDPKFQDASVANSFGFVGSVMPIDCRIVEPCDWENGIIRAVVDFPAKVHDRDACVTHLELENFHNNPVVLDSKDFGQSLPIGSADAKEIANAVGVEFEVKLSRNTPQAMQARNGLRSGQLKLCAYVRVTGASVVEGHNGDDVLCSGELMALQPFMDRIELEDVGVVSK